MQHSNLQLERHFFTKIALDAHSDGKPDSPINVHCAGELSAAIDKKRRFQLVLRVTLSAHPEYKATYTGEIHVVGLFTVAEGIPDDKVESFVECNGSGLLFGSVREMICNLTARGPWRMVTLNSMTFSERSDAPSSRFSSTPLIPERRE
jgi:preprotein translocase subunit SecB